MDIYAVGLSTDGTDACLRVVFQMGIFRVTIMVNSPCNPLYESWSKIYSPWAAHQ